MDDELQQLYEDAPCGYHSLDANGLYVRINQTELTMLGYERHEILGKKQFADLLTEQGKQTFAYNFPRFKQRGWVKDLEFEMIRKDGTSLPVSLSGVAVYDSQGDYLMSRSVMIDISERAQLVTEREYAETQRHIAEARLHYLLSANPAVLYASKASGDYAATFVSDNVQAMLGYSSQDFLDDPEFWASHIHPEDAPRVFADLSHLFEHGSHIHTYRFQHQAGHYCWVRDECKLTYDQNHTPLEVVGYWVDITERKQAEETIQEQADLLNIAPDAIFVHDLDNRILYWNQGAEKLYELSAADAIGQNCQRFLAPESVYQMPEILQQVLSEGRWQGELKKITGTGKLSTVMSRRLLVRNSAGQPKSVLTVDTDITSQKQLEAQFFRAQRLESLGTLASGIAHDLNNVLTPILGIVQLLPIVLTETDEQAQRLLQILQESTNRGVELVKQILSFTRGIDSTHASTDIQALLLEIQTVIAQTFPKNITLQVDVPADLWPIAADGTLLHQVFMNLCVNARDAMPSGGTLSMSAENIMLDKHYAQMQVDAKEGAYVVVTVEDTGYGIPVEIIEKIYDPFFTTKPVGQGTGLGLATVTGIVRNHHGFINVYSEPNVGTRFKVYLPNQAETEFVDEVVPNSPDGHGELILIVDDEVSVQEITKMTLEFHHYECMIANDGIEAIALYAEHKHRIKVILLDLMMPALDSISTIHTLRKLNPDVKIIAMSGLATNEAIARATNVGVESFLAKPFKAQELLTTLAAICL
jgi:two-component system, cell cycle sensor histidine kinase and response regulator CckA